MSDFEQCKTVLGKIVKENGRDLILNEGLFFQTFEKEAPDLIKERKRLKLAFSEGIAEDLYNHRKGVTVPDAMVISRCVNSLMESYGMSSEDAADTVNLIWFALSGEDELKKIRNEKDCGKNLILAIQRAEKGDEEAICAFANGEDLYSERDIWEVYFEIIKLANQGNPFAMVALSDIYSKGFFQKRNDELSFMWAKKAAATGNGVGYYALALCYDYGINVKKDANTAKGYYIKALQMGYVSDFNALSHYSFSENDYKDVIESRKKIASEGNSSIVRTYACISLGDIYGRNLKKTNEGLYWYEEAAKSNLPDAVWHFAVYKSTLPDASKQLEQIIGMLERGANCPDHYLSMIWLYSGRASYVFKSGFKNEQIKSDSDKQKQWIEKLINELGIIDTTFELEEYIQGLSKDDILECVDHLIDIKKLTCYVAGCEYLTNSRCREDVEKAIEYLENAVRDRDPQAAFKLAELYEKGEIVSKDEARELLYYEKTFSLMEKNQETRLTAFEKKTAVTKIKKIYIERSKSDNTYKELADYWEEIEGDC